MAKRPTPPLRDRLRHPDTKVREAARRQIRRAVETQKGDLAAVAQLLDLALKTVQKWAGPKKTVRTSHRRPAAPETNPEAVMPAAEPLPTPEPGAVVPVPSVESALPAEGIAASTEPAVPPIAPERRRTERRAAREPAWAELSAEEVPTDAAAERTSLRPSPAEPEAESPPAPVGNGGNGGETEKFQVRFHPRPHLEPPTFVRAGAAATTEAPRQARRVAFVLHAHLPWVLGHGTWPHGEDWLAEAVAHCYLPLLDSFRRLGERGRQHLLTFSVTPILAAQFADPRLRELVDGYLAARAQAAHDTRRRHPLAQWWRDQFVRLREIWESFDRDLIRTLRNLSEQGVIELATSAATHVYLPLAHRQETIRLALAAGTDLHQRLFGCAPQGCWLPECAYRPAGRWRHPVTGANEKHRPGNEEFLAGENLTWTVLDAHLLRNGDPAVPYWADLEPSQVSEPSGPHPHPYWIGKSTVAAFLRDARTAAQVWSRQGGYPGDPRFLDFHKRHWPSGLRLWRVTHPEADLADKLVYWPDEAQAAAHAQAEHFVALLGGMPEMGGGVVVCPFDAELFGHWWFEGPLWLERVLEMAGEEPLVSATTPARELALSPPRQRARFAEGSWGAGGDHRVWVNPDTEWMWRELGEAERKVHDALAGEGSAPWRTALLNQLLLLAASDWPFLVTTGTARDYAEERFREHAARLSELLAAGPKAPLPEWAHTDLPFPDLDPAWCETVETRT